MTEIKVKSYTNERLYRRDAKRMAHFGWGVKAVEFVAKRRGCIGSLFYWLCFGWLFAILFQTKNGKFVVTYQRA